MGILNRTVPGDAGPDDVKRLEPSESRSLAETRSRRRALLLHEVDRHRRCCTLIGNFVHDAAYVEAVELLAVLHQ